ncbi:MAG: RNA polymerase sigma factor [Bacilli bacterium]
MMVMELHDIFLQLKKGDFSKFDEFYECSKKVIFYNILSYCKNYDLSEDLLQETYVKFLSKIDKIDDEVNVLGYLMTTSKNIVLDFFKKNNKILYQDEEIIIPSNDPHQVDEIELVEKIKKILNQKEFLIFILHVLDDMTFEEIKKIVNKPLGTVLWSYNNAIKKIRKEMEVRV